MLESIVSNSLVFLNIITLPTIEQVTQVQFNSTL